MVPPNSAQAKPKQKPGASTMKPGASTMNPPKPKEKPNPTPTEAKAQREAKAKAQREAAAKVQREAAAKTQREEREAAEAAAKAQREAEDDFSEAIATFKGQLLVRMQRQQKRLVLTGNSKDDCQKKQQSAVHVEEATMYVIEIAQKMYEKIDCSRKHRGVVVKNPLVKHLAEAVCNLAEQRHTLGFYELRGARVNNWGIIARNLAAVCSHRQHVLKGVTIRALKQVERRTKQRNIFRN